MKNEINRAFNDIHADEALLQKTTAYLKSEREKRDINNKRVFSLRLIKIITAIMVFVVGIFSYQTFYTDAATYVSIDVNPSIELTLNRLDKVISATAYNTDGEALLNEISLSGKRYDDATSSLIDIMKQEGYLDTDVLVTLTVQSKDGDKEPILCDALLQLINDQINSTKSKADVEVFPVSQEIRETAHECHMSAAKYLAIQELLDVDEYATLEEYSQSTIQQIRRRTQQCQQGKNHETTDSSIPEESSSGQ